MGTFTAGRRSRSATGGCGSCRGARSGVRPAAGAAHLQRGLRPAPRPGGALLTERAVFRLTDPGVLTEIAPGIDLERDVLDHMDFPPIVAPDLREMDPRIFRDEPMGLARDPLADLDDRFVHDPEDIVLM